MDNAVALVQAYLRVNGYFTVTEYPVVEAMRSGEFRTATDLEEVNAVAGSATVVFDEMVTDLRKIKDRIRECGHHCRGEIVPKHLCEPEDPPAEAVAAVPVAHGTHRS